MGSTTSLFWSSTNGYFKQLIRITWCLIGSVASKCMLKIFEAYGILMWAVSVADMHWSSTYPPATNCNARYAIYYCIIIEKKKIWKEKKMQWKHRVSVSNSSVCWIWHERTIQKKQHFFLKSSKLVNALQTKSDGFNES